MNNNNTPSSTEIIAQLSSITNTVEEALTRLVEIADLFRFTQDTIFIAECNQAERQLQSAIRALNRARKTNL